MKKVTTIIAFLTLILGVNSLKAQTWKTTAESKKGKLSVYYYENEPYAYTNKKGKLVGIEVDILNAFTEWAKEKKGIEIELNYVKFENFDNFNKEVASSPTNTVGIGSIAITLEREKYMSFSAPYLKNVSVLVTDGYVATARTEEELKNLVHELNPVTIKGSIHQQYLEAVYKKVNKKPNFSFEEEVNRIPLKIKESAKYFGYIDIISFWMYVKSNENHFIKMHQFANIEDEEFGFGFSLDSDWNHAFNEFFESGFGFTTTKQYHAILEKYLGSEVINKVEIDY